MDTILVKALRYFADQDGLHTKDETFEVSAARAKQLRQHGLVRYEAIYPDWSKS